MSNENIECNYVHTILILTFLSNFLVTYFPTYPIYYTASISHILQSEAMKSINSTHYMISE